MRAFCKSPKARQARSPRERPKGRVLVIKSPVIRACSDVNGTTSRTRLSAESHAASPGIPAVTSLLCTSQRLTVLTIAPLSRAGVNFSEPRSCRRTASRADASRTTLLTTSGLAPLGDKLIDQGAFPFDVLADELLRPLDVAFQRRDTQLVVFDSQDYFIAWSDS